MVTLDSLRQLQTPEGIRLLAEVRDAAPTPATSIAIATRLRKTCPAELVIAAMEMHDLRSRARSKFSRADEMWFTRDGLEQATSELVARHRASRFETSEAIADLCCGIGGDLLALAARAPRAIITAVDRDPLHLQIATLNARAARDTGDAAVTGVGDRIRFVEADVRDVPLDQHSAVFIDPARRTDGGRLSAGQSEPPLEWCIGLARGDRTVGIKFAPGLDHGRVPDGWEFEAIAIGSDLKEAVLWSPAAARARASATVIEDTHTHRLTPIPGDVVPVRSPVAGETLLDPNPAVTRSGLVEDLARLIGAVKIDDRIGFLLTPEPVHTPFARALTIVASLPWNERLLRTRLRDLDAGPIDIRRRGLAGDVDAITKRLRGKGQVPYTIAMTRVRDQPWALVCTVS